MNEFIFFIGGVFFCLVCILIVLAQLPKLERRAVSRTEQRYTPEREDSAE